MLFKVFFSGHHWEFPKTISFMRRQTTNRYIRFGHLRARRALMMIKLVQDILLRTKIIVTILLRTRKGVNAVHSPWQILVLNGTLFNSIYPGPLQVFSSWQYVYRWWLLKEGTSRNVIIAGFEMILREDYISPESGLRLGTCIIFPQYHFEPQDSRNIPCCFRQESRLLLYYYGSPLPCRASALVEIHTVHFSGGRGYLARSVMHI